MASFVDYYSQCESGLLTRVRTLTDLFPRAEQVSDNDAVLNSGADNFFIVMPGAFPEQPKSYESDVEWHITAELYVRFKEYAASKDLFKLARAKIIWVVKSDDTLGGTANVHDTQIAAAEKPQYYWKTKTAAESGATPNFIYQAFDITIRQKVVF